MPPRTTHPVPTHWIAHFQTRVGLPDLCVVRVNIYLHTCSNHGSVNWAMVVPVCGNSPLCPVTAQIPVGAQLMLRMQSYHN
jgi:hypothetical protein